MTRLLRLSCVGLLLLVGAGAAALVSDDCCAVPCADDDGACHCPPGCIACTCCPAPRTLQVAQGTPLALPSDGRWFVVVDAAAPVAPDPDEIQHVPKQPLA